MANKVRLNIEVSRELADFIEKLAREQGATRTEIVRRALSVLIAYDQQIAIGRTHIGFAAEAGKLDAEMVGIL